MSKSEQKEVKSAGLPKKPKKSSTFAIYDALKANQYLQTISASSHQPAKGLHTNAARWNEVLLPKSFVMKKKRGKKLSTFKKKILMVCGPIKISNLPSSFLSSQLLLTTISTQERLRVSIKERMEALSAQGTPADAIKEAPADGTDAYGVPIHVFNFVEDADLNDEAELVEIVANMKELLQPVGEVMRIRVLYAQTNSSAHVEVTFIDAIIADKAIAVIEGLVCGGQKLAASRSVMCTAASTALNPARAENTPQVFSTNPNGTSALYLFNMVSSEVLEDPEETQEVHNDVQELCNVFGAVKKVWIETRETATRVAVCSLPSIPAHASANLPWAVTCFSHIQDCIASAHNAATHTVAGCPLAAYLYNYDAYQNEHWHPHNLLAVGCSEEENICFAVRLLAFCNVEELQSEEECEETFDNVRSLVCEACEGANADEVLCAKSTNDVSLVDIIVLVASLDIAATVYTALSCRVMGGQPLQVDILQLVLSDRAAPLRPRGAEILHSYDPHGAIADHHGSVVAHTARVCSPQGAAALVVQNYFSAEDLDEGGEAEVAEMKRDLLALCERPSRGAQAVAEGEMGGNKSSQSCARQEGFVHRVHVVRELNLFGKSESAGPQPSGETQYVAGVEFVLPSQAHDAMLHLDERIIGGAELTARIERRGLTSTSTVFVEENTSLDQAGPGGGGSSSPGNNPHDIGIEFLCLFMEEYLPTEPADNAKTGHDQTPGAGAQAVSKYVEAKAAPKLSGHDAPRLAIPVRALCMLFHVFVFRCCMTLRINFVSPFLCTGCRWRTRQPTQRRGNCSS